LCDSTVVLALGGPVSVMVETGFPPDGVCYAPCFAQKLRALGWISCFAKQAGLPIRPRSLFSERCCTVPENVVLNEAPSGGEKGNGNRCAI